MRRAAAIALAAGLAGFSPFRVEERNVREGNEKLAAGNAAAALERYDRAEKAAGARAEIDYDRGNALFRMGKPAEARGAWHRSLERQPGPLASRAHQNIGTALAAEGDREGAIAAFTEALRRDPGNEDARFDLEVLLRQKKKEEEEQQQQQQQQQQQEQGQQSAQKRPEQASEKPRQGASEQQRQGAPEERPAEPGAGEEATPSRQEAERVLDAFRAHEQTLPPPAERRRAWRGNADRDW